MPRSELQHERQLFQSDPLRWAGKWAPLYGSEDLDNDRIRYWPYFFGKYNPDHEPIPPDPTRVPTLLIAFERAKTFLYELFVWKFTTQYGLDSYDKVRSVFATADAASIQQAIEEAYPVSRALVSRFFWLHVLDPLKFPIVDQRVMRTLSLLLDAEPRLWIAGVPTGARTRDYYMQCIQPLFFKIAVGHPPGFQFILRRQIDRALFAFDKEVISNVSKEKRLPVDRPLIDMISRAIEAADRR